jgi:hypothetical protein
MGKRHDWRWRGLVKVRFMAEADGWVMCRAYGGCMPFAIPKKEWDTLARASGNPPSPDTENGQ